MRNESFDKFDLGFVSAYDIDTHKVPKNALSDCLNLEINRPLMMLSQSLGYDTDVALPSYSGSRTVAMKRWSVDNPSNKEIITLIRASENLLRYSEDFEMSSKWTLTAGGATLTPNFGSIAGIRCSDRITNGSSTTAISQSVSINIHGAHTFSVYFSKTNASQIRVTIIEGGNSTTNSSVDASGTIQRVSVTRTIASSPVTVKIDFPDATGTETFDIWGAQIEKSATATGYGYTVDQPKPYYIFMYPYWDGAAWVDAWTELTEQRAGKLTSVVAATSVSIANMDGANDFYNNWRIYDISIGEYLYVYDYTASTGTFRTDRTTGATSGNEVVMSKFMSMYESPLLSTSANIDETKISFVEVYGALRISFGATNRPMIIKYIKVVNAIHGAGLPDIAYNVFGLFNTSMAGSQIATTVTAENLGLYSGVGTNATATGVGLAAGTYFASAVMVVDGQRILIRRSGATAVTAAHALGMGLYMLDFAFNPRLTKIEFYLGTENNDWSQVLTKTITIDSPSGAWIRQAEKLYPTYPVTVIGNDGIDYTQPSLLQNMGRSSELDTRNKFNLQHYLRGHIFTGQSYNVNGGSDQMRFSTIQILTEDLDLYPYSESEGYGYIIVESGSAETIVGFASTRDNDLMIFKERSSHLYEIQSGGVNKRLVRVFESVGLSTSHGITQSDYGVFWYDKNGVYQYAGGVNAPQIVSDGRITRYIQNVLAPYLPTSFATFNRKLKENWIFVQRSGAIGSTIASDYIVLRYSPEYKNWNLLQLDFVPISASENMSGEVVMIGATTNVFKYGYSTNPLSSGYIVTHPFSFGTPSPKIVENIKAIYNTNANLKVSILVNDESSARSGNGLHFLSARKEMDRRPRTSTRFNRLSLKIEKTGGSIFEVSEIEVSLNDTVRRYGSSH